MKDITHFLEKPSTSSKIPQKFVEKIREKARNDIYNYLLHLYPKDRALLYEERINELTEADMEEKYGAKSFRNNEGGTELKGINKNLNFYVNNLFFIMLFHVLGDTIGYNNGKWEFNYGETNITAEYTNELIFDFIRMGGINDFSIINWRYSDDSVMYLATYRVLCNRYKYLNDFGIALRKEYLGTISDMKNRHPGNTVMEALTILEGIEWNKMPYNPSAIGSGTSMRTGCIGIFYCGKHLRQKLIVLALESSRITHNSAIGMLGGLVSALFTAYAIEKVPINHWPHKLLKLLKSDRIDRYLKKSRPIEYPLYQRDKIVFIGKWEEYVSFRFSGLTPRLDIKMMQNPVKRINYLATKFSRLEYGFNPGSCADDSVIIAYDSLLESGPSVEKLIVYSILHPGDSDTVGCIAMGWFAGYYLSKKIIDIMDSRLEELEVQKQSDSLFAKSTYRFIMSYYRNIYLHFAVKHLKNLIKEMRISAVK